MEKKILIISEIKCNFLSAMIYLFNQEKIDYIICDKCSDIDSSITNIITIGEIFEENISCLNKTLIPIIAINKDKIVLENRKCKFNCIVTSLVNDLLEYTEVQKEFLFKKGIYNIVIKIVFEMLGDENDSDGIVIDISDCKIEPENWVFKFDSISETYAWLSNKNKATKNDFIKKVVNFYHPKVYNDSLKEINYLSEKIVDIKNKNHVIDIFVCTKAELIKLKNNYFFKILINNISNNYQLYIVDKDILINADNKIYNKLLDGVAIYEDCIYIDTYDDEYSLGFVDCKQQTIKEYNDYFDYVVSKYGNRIYLESDVDAI